MFKFYFIAVSYQCCESIFSFVFLHTIAGLRGVTVISHVFSEVRCDTKTKAHPDTSLWAGMYLHTKTPNCVDKASGRAKTLYSLNVFTLLVSSHWSVSSSCYLHVTFIFSSTRRLSRVSELTLKTSVNSSGCTSWCLFSLSVSRTAEKHKRSKS